MSTTMCPALWNSARRSRTYANPRWMSGDVASIPSLTRSGRPSFSLRSSSPFGSTSTAFRVRSASAIRGSLVRRHLEVLDLNRLELVGRLEPEHLAGERQAGLERASLRLGAAESVTFALERDVRVRDAVPLERSGDRLSLRRRHDLVVEPLQEEERLSDLVGMSHRRALPVELDLVRPLPEQVLVVPRLELVCLLVKRNQVGDAELGDPA